MKNIIFNIITLIWLCQCNLESYAQLHTIPSCGNNYSLNWSTSTTDNNNYWYPGSLSNTFTNVDGSGIDMTITFSGETSTLGFWAGNTPKVGTQSSYLYKGIDLLSRGFTGEGITCTITFSQPVYAFSFDIHHINKWETNGDKFTFSGKDLEGNTIYPEFTNSATASYISDTSSGIVNAISNITSGESSIIGVNFKDPNYITSVSFLWEDCDTCDHMQLHATGIGDFSFCTPQTLDFDGFDDYINRSAFLGGMDEATMMSWVKLDNTSNGSEIMGQRNFRLYLDQNKTLKAFIKTSNGTDIYSPDLTNAILTENIWYHTALKFDGITGRVTLFLNGNIIWNYVDNSLIGTFLNDSPLWNSNHDFEIGRNTEFDNNYFKGAINECRVYNKALNINQLKQQINQEIENNNGKIRGLIIPMDLEGLNWSDLILYYKMDILNTGFTPDASTSKIDGKLNNMKFTYQDYTAPLPYVTTPSCNGNWDNENNWLHGDEWDLNDVLSNHSIIQVKGNLQIDKDINTLGLIIDDGATLQIKQNSELYNSWYLKLDGTLNLEGESQLIQAENSILDVKSSGTLIKELKGTADKFTYNYWSSPVGKQNNSTINNNYIVKDVFTNIQFLTSGYNGAINPVSISDYWIWKFGNKLSDNYSTWQHIRSTGEISAGEGFTMKGPGTGTIDEFQNYTLEGKPNNGDINIKVYAGNDYLVGNPYPSAIDGIKFIQDNKSSLSSEGASNGTLYFWKHWGGGSHIANDYQGGYATFSLSGGVPAASRITNEDTFSTGGNPDDIPNLYIPPGQGFFTTAETDGFIKFKNSQRVFKIDESTIQDTRMKLRIGFNSVNNLHRQLLVTEDELASPGYDWGYDSKYIDTQSDDLYWLINNEKFTIQGINSINEETVMPLGIHTKTDGFNSIYVDKVENTPEALNIFLHDKELNLYHDLKQGKYETYLVAGEYLNRFEITFYKSQTLNTDVVETKLIEAYFSNEKNKIVINNPASKLIKSVEIFNILGQSLFKFNKNTYETYLEYNASQIKLGNYILTIETEFGNVSKKFIIR
ncbi:LamG-like jellyroll fold domain-containing protein [Litoribaculum gwangyangense]|uniref:T9SS type A sorting domain-containing protein n=1 Tax=Litoribaculum gwangyangense TaxID=1130722 RepID=A0ABP9CW60_9FLAO